MTQALLGISLSLFALSAVFSPAIAQIVGATGPSPFAKDYKVDFAVPDAPAMKLLQVNESSILRPQTVRELGVALEQFRGTAGFVVPKQFAVEVSPGLLAGTSKLSITSYQARRFLHALRLSGATGRDSLDRAQLAFGIRLSVVDEQDLRRQGAFGSDTAITRLTASIRDVYSAVRRRVGPAAPLTPNDDEAAALQALSDSIKDSWADRHWNARSLEFAFGGRALAADSLGNAPKMDELAAWITYADGLQGWGQLLLGAKLGSARDATGSFKAANSIAVRVYIGANDLKAFVEAQQTLSSATDATWLANSGVEFRLPSIGWVNASAGYAANESDGRPRLITAFKLKTALPGL